MREVTIPASDTTIPPYCSVMRPMPAFPPCVALWQAFLAIAYAWTSPGTTDGLGRGCGLGLEVIVKAALESDDGPIKAITRPSYFSIPSIFGCLVRQLGDLRFRRVVVRWSSPGL